jgi:hypothetical protein
MGGKAGLEERMAKVEGVLEQMDKRLNHIKSRLNWTLGTIITMWISIIGLLMMLLMK